MLTLCRQKLLLVGVPTIQLAIKELVHLDETFLCADQPVLPLADGAAAVLLRDIASLKDVSSANSLDAVDNTGELSAVVQPLSSLLQRVNGLLAQWPDNAVLLTIVRVCLRMCVCVCLLLLCACACVSRRASLAHRSPPLLCWQA